MNGLFTWLAILLGFIAGWAACSLLTARRRTAELEHAFDEGYAAAWDDALLFRQTP